MTERPSSLIAAKVRSLVDRAEFDEAGRVFSKLEERRPLAPAELVSWGRIIQLGSGQSATLEDAERKFKKALEVDDEYIPALIELGWFHHAVRDDTKCGLDYFKRALAIIHRLREEAERGRDECIAELSCD